MPRRAPSRSNRSSALKTPRRQRVRAGGFSLVELAVSLAVISLILIGVGSSIVIAAKAMPSSSGPNYTTVTANSAIDQLAAELRLATTVTEATATGVTFTV